MADYNCEWQVGYTTTMIKMLITHQNIKSIPEFKTKIISGVELKSLTFLWVAFTINGTKSGLNFTFWIFNFNIICFRKNINA